MPACLPSADAPEDADCAPLAKEYGCTPHVLGCGDDAASRAAPLLEVAAGAPSEFAGGDASGELRSRAHFQLAKHRGEPVAHGV